MGQRTVNTHANAYSEINYIFQAVSLCSLWLILLLESCFVQSNVLSACVCVCAWMRVCACVCVCVHVCNTFCTDWCLLSFQVKSPAWKNSNLQFYSCFQTWICDSKSPNWCSHCSSPKWFWHSVLTFLSALFLSAPGLNYIIMGVTDEEGRGIVGPQNFMLAFKAKNQKILTALKNQRCWAYERQITDPGSAQGTPAAMCSKVEAGPWLVLWGRANLYPFS